MFFSWTFLQKFEHLQRLLHICNDLTHLHRFFVHELLQLHLIKPCPVPIESNFATSLTETSFSCEMGTSVTSKKISTHGVNWFLVNNCLIKPCLVPSLYVPLSSILTTTALMLENSARPRSTKGISAYDAMLKTGVTNTCTRTHISSSLNHIISSGLKTFERSFLRSLTAGWGESAMWAYLCTSW